MAKNKRKAQKNEPLERTIGRHRRQLENGQAREAVKGARVLWRKQPGPQVQELLEDALVIRGESLIRDANFEQVEKLLQELESLRSEREEVQQKLQRLASLCAVGRGKPVSHAAAAEERAGSGSLSERMQAEFALFDEAVLSRPELVAAVPQLASQLEKIQAALEAVEKRDEPRLLELLQDISRRSAAADWKLFIRGLARAYAADWEGCRQNWSRLAEDRPAWRIAQVMLAATGERAEDDLPPGFEKDLHRLRSHWKASSLEVLSSRIYNEVERGRDAREQRELIAIAERLRREAPQRWGEIADEVARTCLERMDMESLRLIAKRFPGHPLDPNWRRAHANLEERLKENFEFFTGHWTAYLEDIDDIPRPERERRCFKAMVCRLLSNKNAEFAGELAEVFPGWFETQAKVERFANESVKYLDRSLELDPRGENAAYLKAKIFKDLDLFDQALPHIQEAVEHDPQNADLRRMLVDLLGAVGRFANEIEPHLEWLVVQDAATADDREDYAVLLLEEVVRFAAKKKYRLAEETLQSAHDQLGDSFPFAELAIYRVMLEATEGNRQDCVEQLKALPKSVGSPARIWSEAAILSAEFKCGKEDKTRLREKLKAELAGKPKAAVATELARFQWARFARFGSYAGIKTQVQALLKYIERVPRRQWKAPQIKVLAEFCADLEDSFGHKGQALFRLLSDWTHKPKVDPQVKISIAEVFLRTWQYAGHDDIAIRVIDQLLDETASPSTEDEARLADEVAALNKRLQRQLDADDDFAPDFYVPMDEEDQALAFGFMQGLKSLGQAEAKVVAELILGGELAEFKELVDQLSSDGSLAPEEAMRQAVVQYARRHASVN